MPLAKNCSTCGVLIMSSSRQYYCKDCLAEYKIKYRKDKADKIKKYNKERVVFIEEPAQKECCDCEAVLPNECFYRDRQKKTGLSSKCKKCTKKKRVEKKNLS